MKRLIFSSNSNDLILAKGFYINSDTINIKPEFKRLLDSCDYAVKIPHTNGYLIYTECSYDPYTNTIQGSLLNHQELWERCGLNDYDIISPSFSFRVDIDPRNSNNTQLTVDSNMRNNPSNSDRVAINYINKLFKVSSNSVVKNNIELVSIDNNFAQMYKQAAHEAYEFIHNSVDKSQYSEPIFAVCFAIICDDNLGVVEGYPNFVFTALSSSEYSQKVSEYAKILEKPISKLNFKTVYSGELVDSNPGYQENLRSLKQLKDTLSTVIQDNNTPFSVKYYPSECLLYISKSFGRTYKDTVGFIVQIDDEVFKPEFLWYDEPSAAGIRKNGIKYGKLLLPQGFKYYSGFENEIVDILNKIYNSR